MSNNIRTAATIAAQIAQINADAEATGTVADGGLLTVLALEEKAANAIAKFQKASDAYEAQAAVRDIEVGATVTFVVGRAATKRIETGSVLFVGQDKSGLMFNVMTGSGLDSKTQVVGATALILSDEQRAEVEAEIAEAVAAAEAAKSKGEGSEGQQ
ncbi:hypothetical protein CPT_Ponderosa_014 [Stenotrophomonas phage Ponderosa]|uniref:Uncharacterized protein n=1 Tax=Stenotrophomonas phage Ponderosa TaxID=2591103 RepID=A0A5B9NE80_9CAUD|nr:hypothetical protein CPT_Ponderosa_014 [Stenotrophomonas phage Ponderosa]